MREGRASVENRKKSQNVFLQAEMWPMTTRIYIRTCEVVFFVITLVLN